MTIAIVASAVLIVIIALITTVSFYFYGVAVKRSRKTFLRGNKDLEQVFQAELAQNPEGESESTPFDAAEEWLEALGCESWTQVSADGLKLSARYIRAEEVSQKTAILAHGYSADGRTMVVFGRFYHALGFHVLLIDARGHGESEGNYIGFGWPDRMDYLVWIQAVLARSSNSAQIVLHGISMGAATVLMAGGEALPPQVKAIIADCGYTSVWEELSYQLRRIFHLPAFPFMYTTSLLTRVRAGYGFREASALCQAAKIKVPVLFIHGDADTFVPFEMVRRLYDACPAEKDMLVVPGAGHGMAHTADPAAYESRVAGFVGRYTGSQADQAGNRLANGH